MKESNELYLLKIRSYSNETQYFLNHIKPLLDVRHRYSEHLRLYDLNEDTKNFIKQHIELVNENISKILGI